MIRTYKRKLILTVAQSKTIDSWIGVCRLIHNLGIEVRNHNYRTLGKSIHKYELQKQITELKKDYKWISDVPCQSMELAIERLDYAYTNFFNAGKGFPKFASKRRYKSIGFKQSLSVNNNSVRIPKIGSLKMFKDSAVLGTIKTSTIKKEPTGYFICIQCENVPQKFVSENQTIGLDMGITKFCTDSNGLFIENPKHFKRYERKLRIENRSLSRKTEDSNSWKRQCRRLSLLHHTIGNVRKDFLHKESTRIAKENTIVYMEDLKIKNMVRNKHLSKHILDCGWGEFKSMLEYKTVVVKINPAFTSQTCYECNTVDSKSRVNQSDFVCTNCGHVANADINAAKNIEEKGILLDRQREALACA